MAEIVYSYLLLNKCLFYSFAFTDALLHMALPTALGLNDQMFPGVVNKSQKQSRNGCREMEISHVWFCFAYYHRNPQVS